MLKFFKSKIDRLVDEQAELENTKQKVKDKQNEVNGKIETKVNALIQKSYRNKDKADSRIAEIDRKIEKNKKLINVEVAYAQSIIKKR
jgi:hypothetical protein